MPTISVRHASAADRPMVERLWLMFRHDMSEFGGQLPNPDGTFRAGRLAAAFEEQDWAGYVFAAAEDRPAGFRHRPRPRRPGARPQQLLRGAVDAAGWGRAAGRGSYRRPAPRPVGGRVPGGQRCSHALLRRSARNQGHVRLAQFNAHIHPLTFENPQLSDSRPAVNS